MWSGDYGDDYSRPEENLPSVEEVKRWWKESSCADNGMSKHDASRTCDTLVQAKGFAVQPLTIITTRRRRRLQLMAMEEEERRK